MLDKYVVQRVKTLSGRKMVMIYARSGVLVLSKEYFFDYMQEVMDNIKFLGDYLFLKEEIIIDESYFISHKKYFDLIGLDLC